MLISKFKSNHNGSFLIIKIITSVVYQKKKKTSFVRLHTHSPQIDIIFSYDIFIFNNKNNQGIIMIMNFLNKKIFLLSFALSPLMAQKEDSAAFQLDKSSLTRYAAHFTTGFIAQAALNQGIGLRTHLWELPQMTQGQTAVLTASGAAFAAFPLALTLITAVNSGLLNVSDTVKGAAEAHAKKAVQTTLDHATIEESYQDPKARDEASKKAFKARYGTYKLNKAGALAGARGTLLVRVLAVGSTAVSFMGPWLLERYFKHPEVQKPATSTPENLTTDERLARQLERLEKEAKTSPLAKMMAITPEQGFFFGGQLAASLIPNHFGIHFIKNIKNGNTFLQGF
jgi:hypothetical protein